MADVARRAARRATGLPRLAPGQQLVPSLTAVLPALDDPAGGTDGACGRELVPSRTVLVDNRR